MTQDPELSQPNAGADDDDLALYAGLTINQRAFLAAYGACGSIVAAARSAGITPRTHHRWKTESAEYVQAFATARMIAAEFLESVATQRATVGWLEPVFQKGEQVGQVRKYSDSLLMLLLRGAMPERYADRLQHSGRIDGTASQVHVFIPENGRDAAEAGEQETEPEGEPES